MKNRCLFENPWAVNSRQDGTNKSRPTITREPMYGFRLIAAWVLMLAVGWFAVFGAVVFFRQLFQ